MCLLVRRGATVVGRVSVVVVGNGIIVKKRRTVRRASSPLSAAMSALAARATPRARATRADACSRASRRVRRVARAASATQGEAKASSAVDAASSLALKTTHVVVVAREATRERLEKDGANIIAWLDAYDGEFVRTSRFVAREVSADDVARELLASWPSGSDVLAADIADVVRVFARAVYEDGAHTRGEAAEPEVVVTLSLLRSTLCSKLHVDHTSARAMVTYYGATTEICAPETSRVIAWANANARAVCDGLKWMCERFAPPTPVERCDVAILKGEDWVHADGERNAGRGIVHRSPLVGEGEWRLTLKVDVGSYGKCCDVEHDDDM